jgi:hypothetical protein
MRQFRQRNFSNAGLCHILRALVFEAHLKLPGYRGFAALDRAYAHTLTARCNGYALNTLRSALDYIAWTPVERIEIDRGYFADLTAHELAGERKLTAQVLSFSFPCANAAGFLRNSPGASKTHGQSPPAKWKRRYRSTEPRKLRPQLAKSPTASDGIPPGNQVCTGLPAGAIGIRTAGPP